MKINTEPVKSWFGFSRRERRASSVLLIILFFVILLRYFVPEKNVSLSEIPVFKMETGNIGGEVSDDDLTSASAFNFDPNTASYDTLIRLGLDSKAAATLISYRNKGGKFRSAADIKRVYGINETQAERLIPYVAVGEDTSKKKYEKKSFQKQKSLVDLNNCDSAALVRLPGIGPVLTVRILKFRHLLGGFARVGQLKEVYGLPPETYDLVAERVFVDTLSVNKINVNLAGYSELIRLPYLEKYEASAILKFRELKGRITSVAELVENKLITVEKAAKAGAYMRFE